MKTKLKTKFVLILISFLLLANAAAENEIKGETPTIIRITVSYEGVVVEDAKVELFQNNAVLYSRNTNEYGGVLFLLTIDGQEAFEVGASKEGFGTEKKNITIIPYEENSFEIRLRKLQEEPEPKEGQPPSSPGSSRISIPPIVIEIETGNETKTLNISKINVTTLPENITPEEILELFKRKNITLEDFGADVGEVTAGEEFSIITIPDAKVMYCNQTRYADENGKVSFIAAEGQNLLIIIKGDYTSIVPINAKKRSFEKEPAEQDKNQDKDKKYSIPPFIILIVLIILVLIILVFLLNKKRR